MSHHHLHPFWVFLENRELGFAQIFWRSIIMLLTYLKKNHPNPVLHLGEKAKLPVHCEIAENKDFATNFPVHCEMVQSAQIKVIRLPAGWSMLNHHEDLKNYLFFPQIV
jgi:hypothetical protein